MHFIVKYMYIAQSYIYAYWK